MKNYTKADILKYVKDNDIRFIRLQFTDILGVIKNVGIPVSQLDKTLNDEKAALIKSVENNAKETEEGINQIKSSIKKGKNCKKISDIVKYSVVFMKN